LSRGREQEIADAFDAAARATGVAGRPVVVDLDTEGAFLLT
jgi:hypothetical protein